MGLVDYRRKRDFRRTPEPRGQRDKRPGHDLRFVIQKHAATRLHYDFRLELDGVLKSWAVPKGPSLDPGEKRLAIEVEDHPLEYGDFEGTIPKGEYGGGSVLLWDRGSWLPRGDPHQGLKAGRLKFELHGKKLAGGWNLVRLRGRGESEGKTPWLLIKEQDRWARAGASADVLARHPEGVESGRLIEELGDGSRVWSSKRKGNGDSGRAIGHVSRVAGRDSESPEGRLPKTSTARAQAKIGAPSPRAGSARATKSSRGRRIKAESLDSLPNARRSRFPPWIPPQLATLVTTAPRGDEWLHEMKYDGYRMQCRLDQGRAKLFTRTGKDWTARFLGIAEAIAGLAAEQAVLDGEIVMIEPDGTTRFQALQNVLRHGDDERLVYFAFDVLYLDGFDLMRVPLEKRKQVLADLVGKRATPRAVVRYSDHVMGQGEVFYEEACRRKLEGIVSKRRDRSYRSGRTGEWVKVKCSARQEFVIGGFTEPQGSRKGLGALLLGVRDKNQLRYCGRVGTGFTAESLRELRQRLERLETSTPPFANPPRPARGVHWVRPDLVAEVSFTHWTRDGILRHPSFQGLREDKPPTEVIREPATPPPSRRTSVGAAKRNSAPSPKSSTGRKRERAPSTKSSTGGEAATPRRRSRDGMAPEGSSVAGVALSHPDKVMYPEQGLTKLDLAHYIDAVSGLMLPHVLGRPLMLLRCPEGARRNCFFQKHPGENVHPALERVEIQETSARRTYLAVRDPAGLVALIQAGALEIHVWGARAERIEQPDRVVFDLDPDPAVQWADVVETAHHLRKRLDGLGLKSFVKTTGGKGLHIVVPIRPGPGWSEVKSFSAGVASWLVRENPAGLTTHPSKARREGRIFIDALRNGRGATWIAPYSPRARPGAPVSAPLRWPELTQRIHATQFTVANMERRLRQLRTDPWQGMDLVRQTLTSSILRQTTTPRSGMTR